MLDRQAAALKYLARIAGAQSRSSLESMEVSGANIVEGLNVSDTLDAEERTLVDRTIDKIASGRSLEAHEQFALEAIIIPDQRPVLDVREGNSFSTDHPLWQDLMAERAQQNLKNALPAIGRVELVGHPSLPYGGTGFIVGNGLLMTNRHVAEIFAYGLGRQGLTFKPGEGAGIDFERRADGGSFLLKIGSVRMIHPYWDMALLAVEGLPSTIMPLRLRATAPEGQPRIAAIGYPAFDPRNDPDVQARVFHNVYNVKRIMPGLLTGWADVASFGKTVHARTHDSSTTGGASGSAVIDLDSGEVLALHFGGVYLDTNFGVAASELGRDGRVIDAGVSFAGDPNRESGPWDGLWAPCEAMIAAPVVSPPPSSSAAPVPIRVGGGSGSVTVTVPLRITIDIGDPSPASEPVSQQVAAADVTPTEAPVADYHDRVGYCPDFLGSNIPLPEVVRSAADLLIYSRGAAKDHVLRYEHFSVAMSRSRRQCFFSAVNIDGAASHKSARAGWRLDPRIPANAQIINECYGNPPKFSRGHMTRREDPVWGDPATSERGNADSMHVTNTVPQMQAFNSPIWLGLEDYALQHARSDAMKLSVFTGPYFADDDPTMYGVRIPVAFWKVIAFIHDETGRLCATGYQMDQSGVLPRATTEFVFGGYVSPQTGVSTQVPISRIEARAGISFGGLALHDPLGGTTEAAFASGGRLELFDQIRFL
ncbi:MAG: DNA/RNA non-specific endonuclease [Sphingomonas bacterium]